MDTIILTLPKPPSENSYRRIFRGHSVISAEGRAYRNTVAFHVLSMGIAEIKGRLAVLIEYYPPDKRRRDLDNILKSLLDAMQKAGVYADDEQIDDLRVVRKAEIIKGGFVHIRIVGGGK